MASLKDLIVTGSTNLIGESFADIIHANKFMTNNGTSSDFVKGDGSLDSTQYATTTSLDAYVHKTGSVTEEITGIKKFKSDVWLYSASGDTPSLVFQRGSDSSYIDWKVFNTSGTLKFSANRNAGGTYTDLFTLNGDSAVPNAKLYLNLTSTGTATFGTSPNTVSINSGAITSSGTITAGGLITANEGIVVGHDLSIGFTDMIGGTEYGPYIDGSYDSTNNEPKLVFYGGHSDEEVRLTNVADPIDEQDAATKNFVTSQGYITAADIPTYTGGDGIDVSSTNEVSILIDSSSPNGLSVGANGLSLATAVASTGGTGGSAGAMTASDKEKLDGIASGAEVNIQSDWEQNTSTEDDYIKNRPAIRSGDGLDSIIEGSISTNSAMGTESHAEGRYSTAYGNYSHTEGVSVLPESFADAPFKLTGAAGKTRYNADTTETAYPGMLLYYNGTYARIAAVSRSIIVLDVTLDSENALEEATVKISIGSAGIGSHTEGNNTTASGTASHAEGRGTIAKNNFEHAEGSYNTSNYSTSTFGNGGNTLHSIGMGTGPSVRKNALEVMQNGDMYIYGVGDYDGTNMGDTGVETLQDVISGISSDIPSPADTAPVMDGTAAVGTSTDYAREDHVHPSDTSKADKVANAVSGNLAGLDQYGNLTDSGYGISEISTKLVVEDITALTSEQVASLELGDIVVETSGQGAAFIVVQKDNELCQMCNLYDNEYSYALYTCYDNTWAYYMTDRYHYAEIKSTPYFISSSSITSIPSLYIGGFRIGDFVHASNKDYVVSKKTSSECHLVYVDSLSVEEVKYTKSGDTWSYTQTVTTSLSSISDISNKADKVSSATTGNFAGLDSTGNLTDSGSKASDFIAMPSGGTTGQVLKKTANGTEWANESGGTVTDVQVNGSSITSNGVANIVTETAYNASSNKIATMSDLPSVSGKADKVSNATTGDFAGLDANGNLTDSGYSASDFASSQSIGNSKVFYGTCATSASATTKEVVCSDFTSTDLVNGAVVLVSFTNNNSGAVARLKLNVNQTGDYNIKKVYSANGISNLTSAAEICAGSVIPFVFTGTYWLVAGLDYNTNTTYDLNNNYTSIGHIDVGAYPIGEQSLCAFDVNGKLTPFVTTYATETGKTLVTSSFPIGAKIYRANSSYTANGSKNNVKSLLTTAIAGDLRYSSVYHNVAIFPNTSYFNQIFMVVTVNEQNGTFTPTTQTTSGYDNNFTNGRSLIAGNFYIDIGFNSDNATSYTFYLRQDNPMYYYDGTNLIDWESYKTKSKADKVSNAVSGNLAGLDQYGNLTDSGRSLTSLPNTLTVSSVSGLTSEQVSALVPGDIVVVQQGNIEFVHIAAYISQEYVHLARIMNGGFAEVIYRSLDNGVSWTYYQTKEITPSNKLIVSDVTQISNLISNTLNYGDIVVDSTTNKAYIVSTRSGSNYSLVYTSHDTVEEVSYSIVNNTWTYSSTTTTSLSSTVVTVSLPSVPIEIADNVIYNAGELSTLTITLPNTVNEDFICQLNFTSGSTATTLTAPNTIKWTGDDLTSNVFTPVAGKRYTVMFYSNGVNVCGVVKGFAVS